MSYAIQASINLMEQYKQSAIADAFYHHYPFEFERRINYLNNLIWQLQFMSYHVNANELHYLQDDIQDALNHNFYPEKDERDHSFTFLLRQILIYLQQTKGNSAYL